MIDRFFLAFSNVFPSTRANSVQIADTTSNLSDYVQTFLVADIRDMSTARESVPESVVLRSITSPSRLGRWMRLIVQLYLLDCWRNPLLTRSLFIAIIAATVFRCRVLFEAHEDISHYKLYIVGKLLGKNFIFVSISDYLAKKARKAGIERVFWLPLSSSGWKELHDIEPDFDFGYAGSNAKGKGVEIIYEYAKRYPHRTFLLMGDISPTETLPNVTLSGYVKHADLGRQLKRCRVLLAPYDKSVFGAARSIDITKTICPLKVYDYIAARRPVVVSDLENIRSIFSDELVTYFKAGDARALIMTAEHVLSHPESAREKASVAFDNWQNNLTTSARARRLLEISRGV